MSDSDALAVADSLVALLGGEHSLSTNTIAAGTSIGIGLHFTPGITLHEAWNVLTYLQTYGFMLKHKLASSLRCYLALPAGMGMEYSTNNALCSGRGTMTLTGNGTAPCQCENGAYGDACQWIVTTHETVTSSQLHCDDTARITLRTTTTETTLPSASETCTVLQLTTALETFTDEFTSVIDPTVTLSDAGLSMTWLLVESAMPDAAWYALRTMDEVVHLVVLCPSLNNATNITLMANTMSIEAPQGCDALRCNDAGTVVLRQTLNATVECVCTGSRPGAYCNESECSGMGTFSDGVCHCSTSHYGTWCEHLAGDNVALVSLNAYCPQEDGIPFTLAAQAATGFDASTTCEVLWSPQWTSYIPVRIAVNGTTGAVLFTWPLEESTAFPSAVWNLLLTVENASQDILVHCSDGHSYALQMATLTQPASLHGCANWLCPNAGHGTPNASLLCTDCEGHYTGAYCEQHPCFEHGTVHEDGPECTCNAGYYGPRCASAVAVSEATNISEWFSIVVDPLTYGLSLALLQNLSPLTFVEACLVIGNEIPCCLNDSSSAAADQSRYEHFFAQEVSQSHRVAVEVTWWTQAEYEYNLTLDASVLVPQATADELCPPERGAWNTSTGSCTCLGNGIFSGRFCQDEHPANGTWLSPYACAVVVAADDRHWVNLTYQTFYSRSTSSPVEATSVSLVPASCTSEESLSDLPQLSAAALLNQDNALHQVSLLFSAALTAQQQWVLFHHMEECGLVATFPSLDRNATFTIPPNTGISTLCEASTHACGGHGSWTFTEGSGYACVCVLGYSGRSCEVSACNHHGSASHGTDDAVVCECTAPYYGEACEAAFDRTNTAMDMASILTWTLGATGDTTSNLTLYHNASNLANLFTAITLRLVDVPQGNVTVATWGTSLHDVAVYDRIFAAPPGSTFVALVTYSDAEGVVVEYPYHLPTGSVSDLVPVEERTSLCESYRGTWNATLGYYTCTDTSLYSGKFCESERIPSAVARFSTFMNDNVFTIALNVTLTDGIARQSSSFTWNCSASALCAKWTTSNIVQLPATGYLSAGQLLFDLHLTEVISAFDYWYYATEMVSQNGLQFSFSSEEVYRMSAGALTLDAPSNLVDEDGVPVVACFSHGALTTRQAGNLSSLYCSCGNGYLGNYCEVEPCYGHGTWDDSLGRCTTCTAAYTGPTCGTPSCGFKGMWDAQQQICVCGTTSTGSSCETANVRFGELDAGAAATGNSIFLSFVGAGQQGDTLWSHCTMASLSPALSALLSSANFTTLLQTQQNTNSIRLITSTSNTSAMSSLWEALDSNPSLLLGHIYCPNLNNTHTTTLAMQWTLSYKRLLPSLSSAQYCSHGGVFDAHTFVCANCSTGWIGDRCAQAVPQTPLDPTAITCVGEGAQWVADLMECVCEHTATPTVYLGYNCSVEQDRTSEVTPPLGSDSYVEVDPTRHTLQIYVRSDANTDALFEHSSVQLLESTLPTSSEVDAAVPLLSQLATLSYFRHVPSRRNTTALWNGVTITLSSALAWNSFVDKYTASDNVTNPMATLYVAAERTSWMRIQLASLVWYCAGTGATWEDQETCMVSSSVAPLFNFTHLSASLTLAGLSRVDCDNNADILWWPGDLRNASATALSLDYSIDMSACDGNSVTLQWVARNSTVFHRLRQALAASERTMVVSLPSVLGSQNCDVAGECATPQPLVLTFIPSNGTWAGDDWDQLYCNGHGRFDEVAGQCYCESDQYWGWQCGNAALAADLPERYCTGKGVWNDTIGACTCWEDSYLESCSVYIPMMERFAALGVRYDWWSQLWSLELSSSQALLTNAETVQQMSINSTFGSDALLRDGRLALLDVLPTWSMDHVVVLQVSSVFFGLLWKELTCNQAAILYTQLYEAHAYVPLAIAELSTARMSNYDDEFTTTYGTLQAYSNETGPVEGACMDRGTLNMSSMLCVDCQASYGDACEFAIVATVAGTYSCLFGENATSLTLTFPLAATAYPAHWNGLWSLVPAVSGAFDPSTYVAFLDVATEHTTLQLDMLPAGVTLAQRWLDYMTTISTAESLTVRLYYTVEAGTTTVWDEIRLTELTQGCNHTVESLCNNDGWWNPATNACVCATGPGRYCTPPTWPEPLPVTLSSCEADFDAQRLSFAVDLADAAEHVPALSYYLSSTDLENTRVWWSPYTVITPGESSWSVVSFTSPQPLETGHSRMGVLTIAPTNLSTVSFADVFQSLPIFNVQFTLRFGADSLRITTAEASLLSSCPLKSGACSGHGTVNLDTMQCVCDTHYTGALCDTFVYFASSTDCIAFQNTTRIVLTIHM